MKRISRRMSLAAATMRLEDPSMRLTNVDCEENRPRDDTRRLSVKVSRVDVEAKHLTLGAPIPRG